MRSTVLVFCLLLALSHPVEARIGDRFRALFLPPQRTYSTSKTNPTSKTYTPEPRSGDVWEMLTVEEKQFVLELDACRASRGLPQLVLVEKIVEDSRRWSRHLEKRGGNLYHGSPQENCAVGHESGQATFRQWKVARDRYGRPTGHFAKLVNQNDTVCGIGQSGKWWTYRAAPSVEAYKEGTIPKEK